MKTNLDQFYKTSEDFELGGVWLMLSETTGFKVKRFGGRNKSSIQKMAAELQKPYAKQIEMKTIDEGILDDIQLKVFVDTSITDWKGVEINGETPEFSKDECFNLLKTLPDLVDTLVAHASDKENYQESLGNS